MTEFVTDKERGERFEMVRRYRQLRQTPEFENLSDARIFNRMHSEGIDINADKLQKAIAFIESTDDPAFARPDDYMTTQQAAEYVGMDELTFKSWFMPSYAIKATTHPPEGTPVPQRAEGGKRGGAARWTRESVEQLKVWLEQQHE